MPWNKRPQIYWIDRVGMWVLRVSIIGLVALVTVQLLLTSDPFRLYLGLSQSMGEKTALKDEAAITVAPTSAVGVKAGSANDNTPIKTEDTITFRLVNYTSLEKLSVKVNGRSTGDFTQKELTVAVKSGEILEIDSTSYPYPVEISVSRAADRVLYPKAGQSITIKKEVIRLGPVKIKP